MYNYVLISQLSSLLDYLSSSLTDALHLLGTVVPLRGLASLAADMGVPGAAAAARALTPREQQQRRRELHPEVDDEIDRGGSEKRGHVPGDAKFSGARIVGTDRTRKAHFSRYPNFSFNCSLGNVQMSKCPN